MVFSFIVNVRVEDFQDFQMAVCQPRLKRQPFEEGAPFRGTGKSDVRSFSRDLRNSHVQKSYSAKRDRLQNNKFPNA